ncbi:MAG: tRNA (adenosine(37)-N6)-threonylcarbamoyltransferase complex dimerization subunit type 1 TsaB [Rhodothermia bacterium]|nr:MAG: tRNA (adenosine(37)-N6)-threonylcarbamoyltransferase complex dimerization subunit type 1 TsaB [Rhodothermia bacterium]
MIHFLALETATDICDVSVFRDGKPIVHRGLHQARSHAEQLVPMIQECLAEAGIEPANLKAIAVSSGPGSYTGLRIGVSTAKGLAYATGAPIVAVPTLEALAFPLLQSASDPVIGLLPSRRGEVYLAVLEMVDGEVRRIVDECVIEMDAIPLRLKEAKIITGTVCGPGVSRLVESGIDLSTFTQSDISLSSKNVGLAALGRLEKQLFEDTSVFEPYYLREFVARKASRSIFDRLPF